MQLAELPGSGREPPLPLLIELADGEVLRVEQWLRVLPAQRYVGKALWQGKTVLAKLFVGRKFTHHYQTELYGALLLAVSTQPTPKLLANGQCAQGGWLLFDYLEHSQSLLSLWQQVASEPLLSQSQQHLLEQALHSIGSLHAHGLWQDDLHLDNLLQQEGKIWLIDGAGVQVKRLGKPLSLRRARDNLALFFAQLAPELEDFIEPLLPAYLRAGAGLNLSLPLLLQAIRRFRKRRVQAFVKKCTRDCSEFAARRSAQGFCIIRRSEQSKLSPLLATADQHIENGERYKQEGSASVTRVDWHGRWLVLKRYNIKSLWHAVKRGLRESRALRSWRQAHRLLMYGIATPKPLAVIEQRRFGLRGRAYLLTEHCPGADLIACLADYHDKPPPEIYIQALEQLLASLIRAQISHGDLKGHNLLWNGGKWHLIDLDAMQQHRCRYRFARAFARDRERLLRNFPANSALYQLLDKRLPRLLH
ncbi:hypothetical protein AXE65_01595 [Ventosimonas gracilis]|uniref:Serine/threonine protein kinase n=1 Tax=Ventosimonas gracilis TaxID=1680762 RepID=A0A139SVG2_9GAMM|nr:lipopolysaccharide kinase InaA family protein [Ventosimonas gracilis]KXU38432.1 hypothetical protein AXE65_01595 [Ventosimonas gracilis]